MRLTGRASASPCARIRWSGTGTSTALNISSSGIMLRARDAAERRCGRLQLASVPQNRYHRLGARLVPDSRNEFERLELLPEATNKYQSTSVRPVGLTAAFGATSPPDASW